MRPLSSMSLVVLLIGGCAAPAGPSPLEPELGRYQPRPEPDLEPAPVPAIELELGPDPDPDPDLEPDLQPDLEPDPDPALDPDLDEPGPRRLAPVTATEEELCHHIAQVVDAELEPQHRLTPDKFTELVTSCSLALAQQRRTLGEPEFERRAACVRAATTVEGFAACEPDQ